MTEGSRPTEGLPRLLTLAETAEVCRRSVRTIASWRAKGLLRVVRIAGGPPLVERTELERLLSEGTNRSNAQQ